MTELEKQRKELEYSRVQTARKELEYKIAVNLDEISRLKEHIEIQKKKEKEIEQELKGE